jgi:hypothetical protein
MEAIVPADVRALYDQLEAIERDTHALVNGLSADIGIRQPSAGSWSIAECLDHLASGNRVYLSAMREAAERARGRGRLRYRPIKPGLIGQVFVRTLEPPPARFVRLKSPRSIRPRAGLSLAQTSADFAASHAELRAFLVAHADLDLTGIRFPNPFVRGIRFSIATGLHVLAAHERRHLWQAWGVRRQLGEDR